MKIAPLLIAFWIFAMSIALFTQNLAEGEYSLEPYQELDNSTDSTQNPVWQIITNPQDYPSTIIFNFWNGLLVGATALILGIAVFTKSDMVLLFAGFVFLLGLAATPIVTIYSFFSIQLKGIMCPTLAAGLPCTPSLLFTAILVGIPTLMYIFACIEWWTGRAMSSR